MSRFTKFLTLISLLLIIDATFTTLSAKKGKPIKFSVLDYINRYKGVAVKEMQRTKIPASITLAQGILESKYGNSYLARNANNHFGIKCHNSWSGKAIYATDDEKDECFRKYGSSSTSYRDHSNFLRNNGRYSFLFKYKPSDYHSWAAGLGKAGYATNSKYGSHLIRIIERYRLNTFDRSPTQIRQDRIARAMRDYQIKLKGMMNEEYLYPTWFINDRPSQPNLLHNIKRRTPVYSTTYKWSSPNSKKAATPTPKVSASKPKPKPISSNKPTKTIAKKKATPKPKVVVTPKKAAPKPPAPKKAIASSKKTPTPKVTPPTKNITKPQPKATPTPQKVVAMKAAITTEPTAAVAKTKTTESKPKDGLFNALNNWKKKKAPASTSNKKTAVSSTNTAKTHLVKKGDTLYNLSRKYGVEVAVIKKKNGLTDNALKLGSSLIISK